MAEPTVLDRTGDRPLAFTGEMLAYATSKADDGPGQGRWWELALYRTEGKAGAADTATPGHWVLRVSYKTTWQGELYLDSVIVADSDAELAKAAKAFDFMKPVRGYPRGQDEKQNRLVVALTARWERALSVILGRLEPETL